MEVMGEEGGPKNSPYQQPVPCLPLAPSCPFSRGSLTPNKESKAFPPRCDMRGLRHAEVAGLAHGHTVAG